MEIYLLAKDHLEEQGMKWVVESHMNGVKLQTFHSIDSLREIMELSRPNLVILDMDKWTDGYDELCSLLKQRRIRWLGISSERIFQTAYRGLYYHAEDVLFRPFPPENLIKNIQQLSYQIRNEKLQHTPRKERQSDDFPIDYDDLFLQKNEQPFPMTMVAFLTPKEETIPVIFQELKNYSFSMKTKLFALSDFVLAVHPSEHIGDIRDVYNSFLSAWKEKNAEPIAIMMNQFPSGSTVREIYKKMANLTSLIFFEGYDVILTENEEMKVKDFDPLLNPLEQRLWIEMLEKQDMNGIKNWVESEFLTYERPFPDPELVRIRLTSVLAQIRRHMKSYNLHHTSLEKEYYNVFQQIIHCQVVYQIVRVLVSFTAKMLKEIQVSEQSGDKSLIEKVYELIESNYWKQNWNLAECSETLRMNKSTLSRRFKAETGKSFRKYLHEVRIREAKRLLKETDLTLEEIANLTGYAHHAYFTTKFKELEGCTPSAYRIGN